MPGSRRRFAVVCLMTFVVLGAMLGRAASSDPCQDSRACPEHERDKRGCCPAPKLDPTGAKNPQDAKQTGARPSGGFLNLVIEDDEHKRTIVPMIRSEISLGRAEGNLVRLTQRDISPQHARLGCRGEVCWIDDLDSDNGVWVGGKRIVKHRAVREGDLIQIGGYKLFLTRSDDTSRPPAPASRLVMGKKTFVLDRSAIAIGSAPDNDIVLQHPSVSPHHAVVERTWDVYHLVDRQSDTGVRVNGEDYYRVELLSGDEVEIGAVKLRFVSPGLAK